ncbi:MAG: heavy-metal-associated domain-containing protein [Chlorobiaceae bacterium]|nr:heavy-metal-associated domain-containing protein [Chlorobiaceae bacterium]
MKSEMKVSGMRCSGCELLVTEALEELDGVENAEASHQKGTISIDYDPDKVSMDIIKEVIGKQGFNVAG